MRGKTSKKIGKFAVSLIASSITELGEEKVASYKTVKRRLKKLYLRSKRTNEGVYSG